MLTVSLSQLRRSVILTNFPAQEEILQLAIDHPENAVRNSATLRHFAVEAYAYDIAVPGQGCSGTVPVASGTSASSSSVVASATPVASSTTEASAASTTEAAPATTVSSAASECHTHADGEVHCA